MIKKYFLLLLAAILLTGVPRTKPTSGFIPKYPFTGHSKKSEKTKETCIIGFRLSKMFSLPIYQKQNIHDR